MNSIREQIKDDLRKVLGKRKFDVDPQVSASSSGNGDYASNVAMQVPKIGQNDAKAIAEAIKNDLEKLNLDYLEKIEVANPGFINFYLSQSYLISKATTLLNNDKKIDKTGESQKIMVEFAHPNTHKAFHIGHLRNITTGEATVRLLQATGNKVIRTNYEGDVGMHIAKAIYSLLYISPFAQQVSEVRGVKKRVEFLGKAYSAGNKAFEEDEKAKEKIKDINYLVYAAAQKFTEERGERPSSTDYVKFVEGRTEDVDKVSALWKETRQWSLDYFEAVYKRVYTHFDRYYFESECLSGVDIAKEAVQKGILEENEGAIIFNGKKFGLDTRVFVNSLGLPTYEAKELALAEKEFSEFGDLFKTIHVVGPEQASFFKVTFKVEELLNPEKFKDKQKHLVYGWVNLKTGKMSSRTGNVILGEWLLDEAKAQVKKQFPGMTEDLAEKVAVGAVKYSMLKFGRESDIKFSFDESINLNGNSAPYIQYTYARTQSILQKTSKNDSKKFSQSDLASEELAVLRAVCHFEDVVFDAANSFSPNLLCNYLYELCQQFNLFYQKHRVIGSENEDLRILLTASVGKILEKGLYLLGIEAPSKI